MEKIKAIEVPKSETFTAESAVELDIAFNAWVLENERAVICKITPGVTYTGGGYHFYWIHLIYVLL